MQPKPVPSPEDAEDSENQTGEQDMMNLQDQKKQALQAYKMARAAWMETATAENIKGDFEKWKIFCDAKRNCMKLGVII